MKIRIPVLEWPQANTPTSSPLIATSYDTVMLHNMKPNACYGIMPLQHDDGNNHYFIAMLTSGVGGIGLPPLTAQSSDHITFSKLPSVIFDCH